MAFNFPPSPSNGDTYTANGFTYEWDGSKWIRKSPSAGAQGNVGAQGAQGYQGATAAAGAQGAQGAQGHQGHQGAAGAQGNQGHQGAGGSDGTNGAQGAQGHQGHQGAGGTNGTNGTNGAQGAQGHQGYQGAGGSAGAQGNQGHQGAANATTINSNADNRIITGSGTANTLQGESTLTYDGTTFTIGSGKNMVMYGPSGTSYSLSINPIVSTPYGLRIKQPSTVSNGYPLLACSENSGATLFRVLSGTGVAETRTMQPVTDKTYSLGTSSKRYSTIYGGYVSAFVNDASTSTIGEFRNQHSTYGGGVRFKSNNTYGTIEIMRYDGAYGAGFYNSTGGWHWDSNLQFHGSVTPWTNGNLNLGSSSKRWANLYINDLQLSNESKKDTGGNDVDGTWGDWTLQEGESDVYMINNRSGKKFKIKMEEVE